MNKKIKELIGQNAIDIKVLTDYDEVQSEYNRDGRERIERYYMHAVIYYINCFLFARILFVLTFCVRGNTLCTALEMCVLSVA